jgi:anti-anti-sigma factor
MKYTIDKQEKYSLLRLHEEKLDSSVAPGLKSELITLHAEGVKNIVLDLAEVKYTDSSGLSALLVGQPDRAGRGRHFYTHHTFRSYHEAY